MSVSLQKGQKISLTKGGSGLNRVMVGLGWDEAQPTVTGFRALFSAAPQAIDCDASAILCGDNGKVILCFARAHVHTLMLAYTHTQQAQPTTLGHYFSAVAKMFERDNERLQAAYRTVNVSPMGAGAITTSGFQLNRETMCELLGFDSVMENAYDCISASDYVAEAASAVAIYALDYGRLINNLLYWSAQEYGFLKTFRLYVGISSIMPQKRNPTLFEHLRSFSSGVYGDCQKVLVMQHNSTYEDDLDHMDSVSTLNAAIDTMATLSNSLYNAVVTMKIDAEKLEKNPLVLSVVRESVQFG